MSIKKKVILVLIMLMLFTALAFIYNTNNIVRVHTLNTTLSIGEEVGLNLDTDALHFGTIRNKGHSKRSVFLDYTNNSLLIKSRGNISDYLFINDIMVEEDTLKIEFIARSLDSVKKDLSGKVFIYEFRKDLFSHFFLPGKRVSFSDDFSEPQVKITISS